MFFIILLFIGAALNLLLLLYTLPRTSTIALKAFALLLAAMTWWAVTYAFELLSPSLPMTIFWSKLEYLGIATMPPFWLVFAIAYGQHERWLTHRRLISLGIIPAITILLVFTNEYHRLIWTSITLNRDAPVPLFSAHYGIWFWVHSVFSYVCLLAGIIILLRWLWRAAGLYRVQTTMLILGIVTPIIGNVLYLGHLMPLAGLDTTPLTFVLSVIFLGIGIFGFQLVDIVPIARHTVVEKMPEAVISLDDHQRIIDLNPAAVRLSKRSRTSLLGKDVSAISWLAELPDRPREINIDERTYDLTHTQLRDNKDKTLGSIVVLRDVTQHKRIEMNLAWRTRLAEYQMSIARASLQSVDPTETLQRVLGAVVEATTAEAGQLLLLREDAVVHRQFTVSDTKLSFPEGTSLPTALKDWLHGRSTLLFSDLQKGASPFSGKDVVQTCRSAVVMPIREKATLSGVVILLHARPGHFTAFHQQLLTQMEDFFVVLLRNGRIAEAERQSVARQALLFDLLHTVTGQLDLDGLLQVAVTAVARATGWPSVAIVIPNESERKFSMRAIAGSLAVPAGWTMPIDKGVIGRAYRTGKTQNVPDADADPEYIATVPDLRSELAIPIWRRRGEHGQKIFGILDLESDRLNAFGGEEDVALGESIAESLALAIENATLYQEAQQRATQEAALNAVISTLNRSEDLMTILNVGLQQALAATGMPMGAIYLRQDDSDDLVLVTSKGLPESLTEALHRHAWGVGITGRAAAQAKDIVVPDLQQTLIAERADLAKRFSIRSQISLPLWAGKSVTGVFSVNDTRAHAFSQGEHALLRALADQFGIAIERTRLFEAVANEQRRLQAMIDASRDGILMITNDMTITELNPAAHELLSLPGKPQDWLSRSAKEIWSILRHTAPEAVYASIRNIRNANRENTSFSGEFTIDGRPQRTLHYLDVPVRAGAVSLGRLIVLHDVTEERALETMREDLTHMVVHDLRNPLAGIIGALDILQQFPETLLEEDGEEVLQVAQLTAEKMRTLINSILDISQLEHGRMPVDRTPLMLAPLVKGLIQMRQPLVSRQAVKVENSLSPSLPPAWADGRLVERILQNLLDNAIKFTPAGGYVRVSGHVEQDELIVSVTNSGPGISPEQKERLFQKFTPGQHAAHGNGLGLAFCKLAVEAQGGRIWIEGEPGRETVATFTLPLYHEAL